MDYHVNYFKKAQMKIQQMAFVLVALMLLFAIMGIIYMVISLSSVREHAAQLGEDEAKELVIKLTSTPEFAFTSETCPNCVDLDKVFQMKNRTFYKELWNLEFLKIEKIFPPNKEVECENSNYPDCSKITIISKKDFGSPSSAFVSLCHWEQQGGYIKCEIGKIFASGKDLK